MSDKRDAGGLLFYASLFFSRLADQILLFLVPLVVFETTGSVAWSGIAFTLETLPRFLAFPVCGALCDRVSPSSCCASASCTARWSASSGSLPSSGSAA